MIPSQPVFALSTECCVLGEEATNTNFIVFGLSRLRLKPTIYFTRGEHANRYIIDTIPVFEDRVDHKKKVEHV
jgi:hypothetical protein